MRQYLFVCLLVLGVTFEFALAEPTKFPQAKHREGELRYVNGIPVVVLTGTPDEIGEQFGTLVVQPAKQLYPATERYMKQIGLGSVYPLMMRASGLFLGNFPEHHQAEIRAIAKASGLERNWITMTNAFPDLMKIGGCSTLIVEPSRSATKSALFGRLLDWPPFEGLPEYSVVAIIRSTGKHACAVITLPPIIGCISGMNDVGLCITMNEIRESKDQSTKLNLTGTPTLMLMRRVLEECKTVAEAEAFLNKSKRTIWCCLTVCDKEGGCVLEITPKNVVARRGTEGVCCCTNHFRTEGLRVHDRCQRYSKLAELQHNKKVLGIEEIGKELHRVNQGTYTIHSMVFEPATRNLHLAIGVGESATTKPLRKLELEKLFKHGFGN